MFNIPAFSMRSLSRKIVGPTLLTFPIGKKNPRFCRNLVSVMLLH